MVSAHATQVQMSMVNCSCPAIIKCSKIHAGTASKRQCCGSAIYTWQNFIGSRWVTESRLVLWHSSGSLLVDFSYKANVQYFTEEQVWCDPYLFSRVRLVTLFYSCGSSNDVLTHDTPRL